MRTVFHLTILLASAVFGAAEQSAFGVSDVAKSSAFGVSRGGGLFGKDKAVEAEAEAVTAVKEAPDAAELTKYPAMTEEEVEEWLAHIPVFAVTDSNGAGVVLKPDGQSSVFYFFMSPMMANATLTTLKENNGEMDLKISAFSLGKIWFKILNADKDTEVQLKAPGSEGEGETTKGVEYRLVPDTRDLMGARMLLTMDPADGEKLKAGGSLTAEDAQEAIKKAMTESPKFKETFNEIPVFMIAQMRMQKQPAEGEEGDATQLLPMYFSLQNMVSTWQQFMAQAPDAEGVEPAINLMDLHELVAKMQVESEIDFRNVLLIPPVPMGQGGPESTEIPAEDDAMAAMGGDTLGDL
mmetsp:Transcript_21778/g.31795  ORF Transcript_21778/g.31795 Transcript_21778/m.31795 type:complete len:352 (+) Transcript_21778:35-1090(+)|eukprot:CAMPEP_0197234728 /NCGR_PEP_ID=MMETSP1429-20130617/2405_1 /TAXON_ID=49237 /ORGANISM="Chaetoceros  sp., Strain UNC1202" /LENGTH=351 /DNA_ID=CAMNT_0042693205 /DNA_START=69 /DNA_END=1124 /DNA_ORIENTATION=+